MHDVMHPALSYHVEWFHGPEISASFACPSAATLLFTLCIVSALCKMVQSPWKTAWQSLTKLSICLSYDPASNCAHRCLPKLVENSRPYKNLHIYSSSICNCQNGKQPRCPSAGERIQTMEYYLALKRNELWSHEKAWRKLKCILLSERSQSEKATYCMIPTTLTFRKRLKLYRE